MSTGSVNCWGSIRGLQRQEAVQPRPSSYLTALTGRSHEERVGAAEARPQIGEMRIERGSGRDGVVFKVVNAHSDDIHAMVAVSNGNIATGSKDGSLKIWDPTGKLVFEKEHTEAGYEYWVTALAPFRDGNFVSGTRDGVISLMKNEGEPCWMFKYKYPEGVSNRSKQRNQNRINCVTAIRPGDSSLGCYFGTACFVNSFSRGKISSIETSKNDWVYCIESLNEKEILVVTGDVLHVFQPFKGPNEALLWNERVRIIDPKREIYGTYRQGRFGTGAIRAYISAIDFINDDRSSWVTCDFIGQVRLVDVAAQSVIATVLAHNKRAWSVRRVREQIVASSGDDATVAIWDLRCFCRPVHRLTEFPGRVSGLLPLSEYLLFSASCPDILRSNSNQDKAVIACHDLRTCHDLRVH